ncbi:hypothetical protein JCM16408A_56390 [Methylobacterium phyllosphaerae]
MRQKSDLMTIRDTNEPRHTSLHRHAETIRTAAFSHSLHPSQTSMRGNPEADNPSILEIGIVES